MTGRTLDAGYEELASRFADSYPARRPRHTVGRECEFPLVDAAGRAGDHALLWPALAGGRTVLRDPGIDGRGFEIGVEASRWFAVAEVGRGTVEIGVGPRRSLVELSADLDEALEFVGGSVSHTGQRLLGLGIQPRTPPSWTLMTPKVRYEALARRIPGWLRWGVTASDQVHVRLGRREIVTAMNAINACSGALIALCSNSSVYGGRPGAACGREALGAGVTGESFRNGAVPRRFSDLEDYVRWTAGLRCLILPDGRGGFLRPRGTYEDRLRRSGVNWNEYLFHEHYCWPSARPRARLGTLEIRPACQQPGGSFAAAALAVGLVERADAVMGFIEDALGASSWRRLLTYRRLAIRHGPAAPEPAVGFLSGLVDLAARGLDDRGLGEGPMLDEIRERLTRRRGPADEAMAIYRGGGVDALVAARTLPPRS
ncbi:MAG: glutamate-cysteine ligase family protein [Actinomycetota bacterium]|nr:glutamate-cysteine ligase family protein [Actinomycetota bacterium]